MRPVWPSSLAMVAPADSGRDGVLGVAMSCPGCGEVSLNLVSGAHLDVPFYHDKVVRYVRPPLRRRPRPDASSGSTTSCTPPASTASAPTSS